ncbi:hypothetical protein QBC38DRAFT_493467 [Podospora fimiseda]|uniref:Ankyrin repeat protein n=1 Tax=Podospora fimiseda TaxID=252190 RepID=A0AAN7BEG1_9PEZI|nr:hypothetical protein QBC38DRAFT_493467 [Podospora fimiseda]
MLDKGADVNAQGGGYGNALQAASSGGHQEIVKLLLDKGADVSTQRDRDNTSSRPPKRSRSSNPSTLANRP